MSDFNSLPSIIKSQNLRGDKGMWHEDSMRRQVHTEF
jgi:hypothetical protein